MYERINLRNCYKHIKNLVPFLLVHAFPRRQGIWKKENTYPPSGAKPRSRSWAMHSLLQVRFEVRLGTQSAVIDHEDVFTTSSNSLAYCERKPCEWLTVCQLCERKRTSMDSSPQYRKIFEKIVEYLSHILYDIGELSPERTGRPTYRTIVKAILAA